MVFYPTMKSILLFITIIIIIPVYSQNKLDTAIKALSEKYTQEKIHIVYNKETWVSGETIWFKGYVFSGYETSAISTNLYIELINTNKKVVAKRFYPLINGVVDGTIALSDTLSDGVYFIRAYTSLMLNYDESFQYLHPIVIYQPNSKNELVKEMITWDILAQPEGGNLVDGVESKVAVRFISNGDKPSTWSGYLIDEAHPDIKLLSFTSIDPNVSVFSFTPTLGIHYKVQVETGQSMSKSVSLPLVTSKGLTINISQQDSLLDYTINFKGIEAGKRFTLIGTIQNDLVYKMNFVTKDSFLFRSISTYNLPKGVLHFTLFDDNTQVVLERLVFLKPSLTHSIFIDSSTNSINPKGYNELRFVIDSGYVSSMLVISDSIMQSNNDFLGSVWLSSDFKNPIDHVSDYLLQTNQQEGLDGIMMSEKWERFNWENILNHQYPTLRFSEGNYISYTGLVLYKKKPLKNELLNLLLFSADSSRQVIQAMTDTSGQFTIDGLLFEGKASMSYKFYNKKLYKENGNLVLTQQLTQAPQISKLPSPNYKFVLKENSKELSTTLLNALEDIKMQKTLKSNEHTLADAVVRASLKNRTKQLADKLISGRFTYARETIIDFINTEQPSLDLSVRTWLLGRMGAPMPKNKSDKSVLFFVDEFDSDLDEISLITMSNVAMIKLAARLNQHFVFIYLKRGGEMTSVADPLNNTLINGYSPSDPYPMPNYFYDSYKSISKDKRQLLYWGKSISNTNLADKVTIKFFNNDFPSHNRLVLLGTNPEGLPFYSEINLNSNKLPKK